MHNHKFIIYTLLTFMLILPFVAGCSNEFSNDQPKAKEGIFDLTQWGLENRVVRLDGRWEFYPNHLLEPRELMETGTPKVGYIDIPSSWNRYILNDTELTGDGYATYRLFFKTEEKVRLGIKIPRIFTSYNLWVNEELVATAGTVGTSRETMTPQYLPQIAFFESHGENEIVIQVANFYHRSGGILESLVIGNEKQIFGLSYKKLAYELILFGSLIIIGAYHLALYFFRRKNTPSLYFGLFCLFVGVRTLLVGEMFFIYIFPDFSWELAHKIKTLIFYLGVPIVLMYFKSVFPNAFLSKIVKIVLGIGIAFGSLVLLTPAKTFTFFNPLYQIFALIVIVYIIFTFIRLFFRKEKDIGLIFGGALALLLTSLYDIIFLSIWMNDHASPLLRAVFRTGNLSSVGQLIFVFANALVLAQKFSIALEQEEVMTAKLKEINLNLDELVIQRTEDLDESIKKIEYQKLELENANQALQLLSLKDPLTELWNRRHYDDTLQMEWNRGLRHKTPISLMILDIDYFKNYNDCYGHKAGDECLIKVAQATKSHFKRVSDLVVRYGGEEFVVIMPGVGIDEAVNMALMLRKSIELLNIPHNRSLVSPWVTVSIGVTSAIPDMNCSQNDLFLSADKALYVAKDAGRNHVEWLPLQAD